LGVKELSAANEIAAALGKKLIDANLDLVLTGGISFDERIGKAAISRCEELGLDPRERIRTYPYGTDRQGYGMVLNPIDERFQEVRTFVIQESDGVVALAGSKGTSDCVQKCVLAKKPVFPIAVCGGAGQIEWERLKRAGHYNRVKGDLDFLADRTLSPSALASSIVKECQLIGNVAANYSRRVFIVHGHDNALKSEIARFLEQLDFVPVILHEQPDSGRTVFDKLEAELADVGFAFVLLSPDDFGGVSGSDKKPRARQNVIFEHGLLAGRLGPQRVCAIVKSDVELPSDLHGVLYKHLPTGMSSVQSIALDLILELKAAGYEVDANRILGEQQRRKPATS